MASDTALAASATTFSDLPLHGDVSRALGAMRFLRPSPIQLHALPVALFGNDVIGQAKSGTGKTAVFGVAAIEHAIRFVEQRRRADGVDKVPPVGDPLVLILAPTREIAVQIETVLRQLAQFRPEIVIRTCIGGLPVAQDQVLRTSNRPWCWCGEALIALEVLSTTETLGCGLPYRGGYARTREGADRSVFTALQCDSTARIGRGGQTYGARFRKDVRSVLDGMKLVLS